MVAGAHHSCGRQLTPKQYHLPIPLIRPQIIKKSFCCDTNFGLNFIAQTNYGRL